MGLDKLCRTLDRLKGELKCTLGRDFRLFNWILRS